MKKYPIQIEIAGDFANFTDPATGDVPVSYPCPTSSSTKAIFESIILLANADVTPLKVEICKPIKYIQCTTNYKGPFRAASSVSDGLAFQSVSSILRDVCYRIYAESTTRMPHKFFGKSQDSSLQKYTNKNGGHAYQEMFNRFLKKGRCRQVPYFGNRDYCSTYFGEFREGTIVCDSINISIPSMLYRVFKEPFDFNGGSDGYSEYRQDVKIVKGVLSYV